MSANIKSTAGLPLRQYGLVIGDYRNAHPQYFQRRILDLEKQVAELRALLVGR